MPKDQRIGQPLRMPTKNYFKKNPSAKGLLKIVNKDLKEVHKVREGVQMREIKCKILFYFCIAFVLHMLY